VIDVCDLTKRYGRRLAVDGLTFTVRPGQVTGFLGPNGAGKSTTMRLILGLDAPTRGSATIGGRRFRHLRAPLTEVGALLDGGAAHPGRSAYHHVLYLAQSNGISRRRVGEVLETVGLASVARTRTKGFSLGMKQRLGIAAALLGDPAVLILDEPVNGLDTDGIRWIRELLTDLAAQGRTVLLSSHLMGELEQTAAHLVVIGGGRLIADMDMRTFIERNSVAHTVIRSPRAHQLIPLLRQRGADAVEQPDGTWRVTGLDAATVGDLAHDRHIPVHELTPRYESLEAVYTRMTTGSVEFRGSAS
jgi:ABC-2 type transport system ATP-binding protein